mgnify:CR=1 FL=1
MIKTLRDFDLENKKVIIRCDLNVPIKDNKIEVDISNSFVIYIDELINKEYIRRRAAKYCHSFDTLSDEVQDKVIERIWNRLKRNAPEKTEEAKPANREELKQKIEDYFARRDGLEFSTEEVAEDLASLLSGEESELNEDSADNKKLICTSLGGLSLGPIGLLAVEGLLNTKKGLKWLKGKRISSKK